MTGRSYQKCGDTDRVLNDKGEGCRGQHPRRAGLVGETQAAVSGQGHSERGRAKAAPAPGRKAAWLGKGEGRMPVQLPSELQRPHEALASVGTALTSGIGPSRTGLFRGLDEIVNVKCLAESGRW